MNNKTYKLKIPTRISLLKLLPEKSDISDWTIKENLRRKLLLSKKELSKFKISTTPNGNLVIANDEADSEKRRQAVEDVNNYLRQYSFDAYDDLELVKQWGESNPTISENYDQTKIKPITKNIFAFLRGKDQTPDGDDEFYDLFKVASFGLGCAKALAKKHDEQMAINSAFLQKHEDHNAKIQALEKKISNLQAKLDSLKNN